jgi:hypothetical protein
MLCVTIQEQETFLSHNACVKTLKISKVENYLMMSHLNPYLPMCDVKWAAWHWDKCNSISLVSMFP